MNEIERANAEAMKRYRNSVLVEVTSTGAIHVTLDGQHYVDDPVQTKIATMRLIAAASALGNTEGTK